MTPQDNIRSDLRYCYDTLREVKSAITDELVDKEQEMFLLGEVDECLLILEEMI